MPAPDINTAPTSRPSILCITGASGAVYATRLLEVLLELRREVHLSISPAGAAVLKQELNIDVDIGAFDLRALLPKTDSLGEEATRLVRYHHYQNLMAPIASGSFLSGGMVICPCSGGTLSAVVHGTSSNLIQRAADVQLKERRKLILVPRETPLSGVHLANMQRANELGAVVLPAMPGWYHGVKSLQDMIDFIVARILDQLEIPHELMRRWGD